MTVTLKKDSAKITQTNLKRVARVHELKSIMAVHQAEIDKIKDEVIAEMTRKGVNKLTNDGVVVVANNPIQTKKINTNAIFEAFPEINAVAYTDFNDSTRIDWKKPV